MVQPHGDGRFASRFRPDYVRDNTPRVVGLCSACLRPMWSHVYRAAPVRGRVTVSTDGLHCNPCLRYIRDTGCDPQTKKGSAAERIPAELPEPDDAWRYHPGLRCRDSDPVVFAPDPLTEELATLTEEDRESTLELRRFVAEHVCGPCPVRRECAASAAACGYEGLWGGRFFTRTMWMDPLRPDVKGPTRYTPPKKRRQMLDALKAAGLDADGEPVPDGNRAAS